MCVCACMCSFFFFFIGTISEFWNSENSEFFWKGSFQKFVRPKATYICLNILKVFINKLLNKYILCSYLDVHNKLKLIILMFMTTKLGKVYKIYGFYVLERCKAIKINECYYWAYLGALIMKHNSIQVSNKDIIKNYHIFILWIWALKLLILANKLLCYYNGILS